MEFSIKMSHCKTAFVSLGFIVISALVACTTTATSAGEIEGVVVMVGSVPNARPIVEPNGPKSQLEICPGKQQDFLRKFGGTIVKATGEWGRQPNSKERCFTIQTLQVTQLVKGRTAYTGMLIKEADTEYSLLTSEGKKLTLEHPSKGIIELAGKKVVMDLVPSSKANEKKQGEPLWKVVTYLEHPVL